MEVLTRMKSNARYDKGTKVGKAEFKEHNIHYEPKYHKLKLLGKLVIQHGIRTSFGGRSCVHAWPHIYFLNLLSLKKANYDCLPNLCIAPHAGMDRIWGGVWKSIIYIWTQILQA